MAGVQGGLVPKGTINSADIKNPSDLQAQIHRDEAASGSGSYYGKQFDGVEELIGGPGAAAVQQMAVEVNYDDETRILTTIVYGGVGPFVYDWEMKNFTDRTGEDVATFTGATNAASATVTAAAANDTVGLATVKVTDAQGRVTFGSFLVDQEAAA